MEMNDQLHAPGRFTLGEEQPIPIGQEASWAPEPVWTLWRRQKSVTPTGNKTELLHRLSMGIFVAPEVRRDFDESGIGLIEVIYRHMPEGTEEYQENISVRITCISAEIRTGNFPNNSQPGCSIIMCWRLSFMYRPVLNLLLKFDYGVRYHNSCSQTTVRVPQF
jgi:hypothetical protein